MKNLSRAIVILFFLLLAFSIQAANPLDIVINEIAWMGTKVKGVESKYWWQYEWIELYNNTDQEIELTGWQIENGGVKNKPLEISQGKIPAKGFFLLCKKEVKNCNFKNWGLSLNDDYQANGPLILKNNFGEIIDQTPMSNSKKWPAGNKETKQTMERKNELRPGFDPGNWQVSQVPGGTPKAKNTLTIGSQPLREPTPELQPEEKVKTKPLEIKQFKITYPSGIRINEVLPSPSGADELEEWIEIFNQNNFEVDLSNWQITDLEGKTTTFVFPSGTKISPKGFLVLSRPTTKITLNNKSDGLNLFHPNGNIIDSVVYEKAPRGESFNRTERGWAWSPILTPNSTNILPSPPLTQLKPEEKPKLETELPEIKEELAAIGEQIPKESPRSFFILLIALTIAISAGIIILILKRRLKHFDLSKKLE